MRRMSRTYQDKFPDRGIFIFKEGLYTRVRSSFINTFSESMLIGLKILSESPLRHSVRIVTAEKKHDMMITRDDLSFIVN